MVSIVRLLALYCPAVGIGPPLRLSFVPAVLLALYCRAVDIAVRLIMVCRGVCRPFLRLVRLLALYCRAVDIGPPWRLSSVCGVSAGILPPCGVLLAHYCRAVDNGPPWRVSFVPAVLLALYCPAVVMVRRCVCGPFLRFVRPLAFYCPAVDNGPPWCLSSVC